MKYLKALATKIYKRIQHAIYWLLGRCRFCGGKLWHWSTYRHYCRDCGEKQ